MSARASIVLLTAELPPYAGGVATYCHRLASLLQEAGHPVAVVAPAAARGQGPGPEAPYAVRRVANPPLRVAGQLFRLAGLVAAVRRHRPRILWAADWRPGVLVSLVARLFGLPFAVTVYGSELLMVRHRAARRWLARRVLARADVVLAISRYAGELARQLGVPADRLAVVPLGVDPVAPASDEEVAALRRRHRLEGGRVLLTLARLTPRKGHDVVLRALPEIRQAVPDVAYLVAGTGEDGERLRELARSLGVEDSVVFAGFVAEEEKAAYYRLCEVFVMPSRQEGFWVEGFGLAFLEAGAHGRPVVGGRHGGVPEAVVDGETGLLVDPEDPRQVARAVVRLLTDRRLAAGLGAAARRRVEREASWQRVADETLARLRSAWEGSGR